MTVFNFTKGIRSRVPLLIGLVGPSGVGKTFSALRLAEGIRRVTGGRTKVIDTEHRRALHYADRFDFDHCDFTAPFSSLRYMEAIRAAVASDPGPVVIDSASHEHDGPGGYLEFHEQEVQRLCTSGGFRSEYAAQVPAWAKPAEARRKFIQGIIHLGVSCIFCFRAKEKIDMNAKKANGEKTVAKLGWMPIAGDAFVYEMTLKCLLLPGADGIPTWHPEEAGERLTCKLPGQFHDLFAKPQQLSEDIGARLAEWAAGTPARPAPAVADYERCDTRAAFDQLEADRAAHWKAIPKGDQAKLKAASEAARRRVEPPADNGIDEPAADLFGATPADTSAIQR